MKPKILCLDGRQDAGAAAVPQMLQNSFEVVGVSSPSGALSLMQEEEVFGVYIGGENFSHDEDLKRIMLSDQILASLPDGVVLLDADNNILWTNRRFCEWAGAENVLGQNFYRVLGDPELLGPDYCPFATALATGAPAATNIRTAKGHVYMLYVAPVLDGAGHCQQLIVSARDVTQEVVQQQKLEAIHKAGVELSELTSDQVFHMNIDERIGLLKASILHCTKDLLHYNVVEIRLLDQKTRRLEPLLADGMDEEAAQRVLYACAQDNGVTGFVAATGKSYLCEDTTEDPLYLQGFRGALSSLTVPLTLHDQVIGTFNVESPEKRAFTDSDQQFLEIFARNVAAALNTFELLNAQRASTAWESVEAIHSAVALPVDDILNEAVHVMERYIGHDAEVVGRLQKILRNARDIKQVIQKVGQTMTPIEALPSSAFPDRRPKLHGRRILVIDADESVRNDAHRLLERQGCDVETAQAGEQAVLMVRSREADAGYDVIIADIRLADMCGYDLFLRLRDMLSPLPLVLMTGFGYDPTHSIPNSRKAGLPASSVLYKPFRLDQLLKTVETVLDANRKG